MSHLFWTHPDDLQRIFNMEEKNGSIEAGKYADLVILEKNLFDVKPRDIAEVKVLATMMDGKFTYQAEDYVSQDDTGNKYSQLASIAFARIFCCGRSRFVSEPLDQPQESR